MSLEVFEAISSRLQAFSDHPQCLFKHCHLLSKRDSSANTPNMPVVFLPQKNTVECERVSRMSSWGFMSFVLAVVNGVINVSNNINSNNNNRNNNNNDQNSNQFNTNLGNTNNVQMAGGMAMSGRRLPALARLWDIREKFKRKIERQLSSEVGEDLLMKKEDGISQEVSSKNNLQVASHVLEQLYKQEVERKQMDRATLYGNVTTLFHHLYKQQKLERRSKRQDCLSKTEQSTVISKVSSVALSFIELWTYYHTSDLGPQSFREKLCKLLIDAGEMGKVTKLVGETIKDHFLYLIDQKVTC